MNNPKNSTALLDMFQHPVFRVKDGHILEVNSTAETREIQAGIPIADLLPNNYDVYCGYTGGCLSISVQVGGVEYIATVLRSEDGDIFHLQDLEESPELRIMALAAQQLRNPLSEVMTATETLFSKELIQNREQIGLINKGLFQLLREIGNMSAVSTYKQGRTYGKETKNAVAVINETMEKAQVLCSNTSKQLRYTSICEAVYCSVDEEMLERAIYNLVSNAIKFSPANSTIDVKLSKGNNKLCFSIESETADTSLTHGNLFMRYIRDASVEDGRHGLGLGIPLTQYAAAAHKGALLMDHPSSGHVRFTLTLSTQSDQTQVLKTPFPKFDYMGGWDHGLVELSDVLPASQFENL